MVASSQIVLRITHCNTFVLVFDMFPNLLAAFFIFFCPWCAASLRSYTEVASSVMTRPKTVLSVAILFLRFLSAKQKLGE